MDQAIAVMFVMCSAILLFAGVRSVFRHHQRARLLKNLDRVEWARCLERLRTQSSGKSL
jgi:hypothetical protein